MQGSIKSRYGNEILDRIFRYFMRMILHLQNSGIEKLPLENDFQEPLKSFIDIAVDLIIDGQPPEIASLILDAEYDAILSEVAVSVKTAISLRLIKELSWHIHYDEDYYEYLLYQIHDLIKYIPKEAFRLEDY